MVVVARLLPVVWRPVLNPRKYAHSWALKEAEHKNACVAAPPLCGLRGRMLFTERCVNRAAEGGVLVCGPLIAGSTGVV